MLKVCGTGVTSTHTSGGLQGRGSETHHEAGPKPGDSVATCGGACASPEGAYMPDEQANFWNVILGGFTLLATLLVAVLVYKLNRRQTDAAEQQSATALIQSINTYDFDLHKIFMQYPKLRPYIYGEPSKPVEDLEPEERQQLRAVIGYLLDFFHLISYLRSEFPARVPTGYVEWMQDVLTTNTLARAYLDEHAKWQDWFKTLDQERIAAVAKTTVKSNTGS